MGNEMGNQNASGIKGEENEATDAKEKVQGAAPEDVVKGENHIIPEGESKDYHAKADELSNHDMPAAIDSDHKLPTSDEREEDEKETKPPAQFPEVVLKEELVCENGHDIQTAALRDEDNPEESLESNVEYKIVKIDIEVHGNKPFTAKDLKSEAHESTDFPTQAVEGEDELSFRESKETEEISASGNGKENGHLTYTDNAQDHAAGAVPEDHNHYEEEKRVDLEDKLLVMSNLEEKCDITSSGYTVENSLTTEANGEVPPEMKPSDSSEFKLDDVTQTSSLDCFTSSPELNERSMVLTEKIKLIASEPVNGENIHDILPNQDAAYSNPMTESCQMVNEEESSVSMNSCSDFLKEIDHAEEVKVSNNVNQNGLAGNNFKSLSEAPVNTEDVIEMMPEVGMPTETSMAAANYEEEKVTEEATMENAKEEKEESYITTGNESDREGTLDKNISPLQSPKKEECLHDAAPDASDDNGNDEIRPAPASGGEMENQEAERELEQKIHSTSETVAEAELPPKVPHEQYANGETSTPFAGVAPTMPESMGRHSVESNPEKPCDRIELRKCPSFDFGIPLDARSEESDQTPLLRHDKTVFRSFSSCSNVDFHSENGRSSLDYERVVVEEKTIRMERSDSDNSRGPFFSLMKKEVASNAAITPQTEENYVASKKLVNESGSSPANELEYVSPRGSGKRKPRSSFFSTCLCCTAAIS